MATVTAGGDNQRGSVLSSQVLHAPLCSTGQTHSSPLSSRQTPQAITRGPGPTLSGCPLGSTAYALQRSKMNKISKLSECWPSAPGIQVAHGLANAHEDGNGGNEHPLWCWEREESRVGQPPGHAQGHTGSQNTGHAVVILPSRSCLSLFLALQLQLTFF